jgi:DNA-binding transcriptional MerR regulator
MKPTELKLDELAERAGVSPRTVRYYIQRGLLTAPAFRGADTSYGEEHLVALRAIKKLQEAYWPLDTIAGALAHRSPADLERIASGALVPPRDEAGAAEAQAAPAPAAAHPYRHAPAAHRTRVERVRLADGVELSIEEGASKEARALVENIVRALERGELTGDLGNKGGRR